MHLPSYRGSACRIRLNQPATRHKRWTQKAAARKAPEEDE